MSNHINKYLVTISALLVVCFVSACYYIHAHTETKAKERRAKYFSDLEVVAAAGYAMKNYTDHHKGVLPDKANWEESIEPYWQGKNHAVSLKEHPGNRLAMNSELSGRNAFHDSEFAQLDGPILLYETCSSIKDANGFPPWKECHQCGEATRNRLMIAFASGWAYSYTKGPALVHVNK